MSISIILSILNFLKKYWPFLTIAVIFIVLGIVFTVFSIKLNNANRKIEKLEQEKVKLELTNRILVKDIENSEKNIITKTNFINSDNAIEIINPNRLPDDFINSINSTFRDYNFNLSNNTLSNNKK